MQQASITTVQTALIISLPRICPSIRYRPYLQRIGGSTLLEWAADRLLRANVAYPIRLLVFGTEDAERARALLGARPITIVGSRYRSTVRSLAEIGGSYPQDVLLVAKLETLCLAPLTILGDVCGWHRNSKNTYTPVVGLPENATLEVIDTSLLRTFCAINLPRHLQEPRMIVQSLLASSDAAGQELPFGLRALPFDARAKYGWDPIRNLARVSFQTPGDVAILRAVTAKLKHKGDSEADAFGCWKQQALRLGSTRRKSQRLSISVREWIRSSVDERPFRVLYVSHASAFSGAQQSLLNLVRALDRNVVEPHVLVGLRGVLTERLAAKGVPVYCRNREFVTNTIDTMRYLMSTIVIVRPHVIHMNGIDGFPILSLAHILGIPVVAHLHLASVSGHSDMLCEADAVVAVSDTAKRAALEVGVRAKDLFVVYNGIECFDPRKAIRNKSRLRQRFRFPSKAKIALMVARFNENKRQDMFIDAMSEVRRAIPSAHAVCVGEPYSYADVAYYDRLVDRIRCRGMQGSVTIMGFQRDILAVEAACDVVVSCSRSETLGTALLEGMALGLPVVATRSGGSCEVVTHGETGFLVSNGDAGSLRDRLRELLSDDGLCRRMGEVARREVRGRFRADRCAKAMEEVYEQVIRQAGSQRVRPT